VLIYTYLASERPEKPDKYLYTSPLSGSGLSDAIKMSGCHYYQYH